MPKRSSSAPRARVKIVSEDQNVVRQSLFIHLLLGLSRHLSIQIYYYTEQGECRKTTKSWKVSKPMASLKSLQLERQTAFGPNLFLHKRQIPTAIRPLPIFFSQKLQSSSVSLLDLSWQGDRGVAHFLVGFRPSEYSMYCDLPLPVRSCTLV